MGSEESKNIYQNIFTVFGPLIESPKRNGKPPENIEFYKKFKSIIINNTNQ